MREADLPALPYRSLRPFVRMLAGTSAGATLLERDGVLASVVPVTPTRSITNSVVYEHPDALAGALGGLADAYAEAGVRAWTVWVPDHDAASQALLAEAGHALDATPAGMALELGSFERSPDPALDLATPTAEDVGSINDVAYGYGGDFVRAFTRRPEPLRVYGARANGRVASCVGAIHDDGDCGIYLVATLPEARGRSLARDLMIVALNEAREAGCETASLQSTAMGKPVYERLGFRDFGPIGMWERRAT
jgi:GNAT superfamily N-acetyltransferase